MNNFNNSLQKSKHWLAFGIAIATATAFFLPFVIYNRGFFIFIGDFNVQQIPFYKLAHEAVRSGDIFWNWYTDLGANFIGSYSFYLLFSPFFWLTLPFPTELVPYLMAPLLILKTGCAAFTSYFYIQRFVKDKNYAVLGALLYAFSSFTAINIFFNHFHEAIVFFPLMLVGLEELLVNNRRGVFAVSVAVNAIVNYWFFVGEVVFIVLYYFIRCTGLKDGIKKIVWVALEGILGCLCAAGALLPSALAVMGNPRTTLPDNMLSGWQFWLYTHEQRQPGILASFFFPPETPSRPNMFPDHGAKWASLSAWLPVFSMSGVLAFLISSRKNWLRKLIITCFVIAMVPGLNSIFVGLNHSYYARWLYMLVLMLAAATVIALENQQIDFARGFKWCAIITGCIIAAVGLTPVLKDGAVIKIGLAKDMPLFWVYAAVAVMGLLLCYIIVTFTRKRHNFTRIAIAAVAVFSALYTGLFIGVSKQSPGGDNFIIDNGILGRSNMNMPVDDEFYRTDIFDSGDNMGMYWHLPNIQAFHSIVPASIMKFYPEIGVKRDVSSRPQPEFYALRSLFSVKYLFIEDNKEEQEPMPGYKFSQKQLSFNVYENENFLPMGFAYDAFITEDEFAAMPEEQRNLLLMRAVVLNNEQSVRLGTSLNHLMVNNATPFNYKGFLDDVSQRRSMACTSFSKDNLGFTAKTNFDRPRLVYFSVPQDAGWSATVNGSPVDIETVDIGFMAVQVPAGDSVIRFDYRTPGLFLGLTVSGIAVLMLILYVLILRLTSPRKHRNQAYELFEDGEDFLQGEENQLQLDALLTGESPQKNIEDEAGSPYNLLNEPDEAGGIDWDESDFTGLQQKKPTDEK
ncbi:MAG: YfhO family protein [Hydrogenoanaerobacterium sp.]